MSSQRPGCCGGGGGRNRLRSAPPPKLPKNPETKGPELVYVGSRIRHIRATVSGMAYHVAPGARYVRVDQRDVDEFLSSGEFVRR